MGNFTNAQTAAPNPWLRRNGFFNVANPNFFHGLSVLPAMNPARASASLEFNYETSEYEEVEGWTICLTEVVAWPYSEDEIGTAFDQANLYGVRTRVWRLPIADGGGDKTWLTAVPKALSVAYTAVARCSLMHPPDLLQDFLGANPMVGFSWNHRTPTGLLLDTTTPEGAARARWTPMNLNDQVLESELGDAFTGQWVWYGPYDGFLIDETLWLAAQIASSHVGFRGGKLTFNMARYSWPVSGSFTYEIVAVKMTDFWDPIDPSTESVIEVMESGTVSWDFPNESAPAVEIEHTLGDMRPADVGIPYNFYLRYAFDNTYASLIPAPIYYSSHLLQLSPRTDVPLPYFASQRNRVAPGGIIQPPP